MTSCNGRAAIYVECIFVPTRIDAAIFTIAPSSCREMLENDACACVCVFLCPWACGGLCGMLFQQAFFAHTTVVVSALEIAFHTRPSNKVLIMSGIVLHDDVIVLGLLENKIKMSPVSAME